MANMLVLLLAGPKLLPSVLRPVDEGLQLLK